LVRLGVLAWSAAWAAQLVRLGRVHLLGAAPGRQLEPAAHNVLDDLSRDERLGPDADERDELKLLEPYQLWRLKVVAISASSKV
jgi:hypothetical protein